MGAAVLAEPKAIKISSKRQITIPANVYEQAGFKDYALCTWTEKGLLIQPIEADDEDAAVFILRQLVDAGYGGDELVEAYKRAYSTIAEANRKLELAEHDIEEGRTLTFEELRGDVEEKHGHL